MKAGMFIIGVAYIVLASCLYHHGYLYAPINSDSGCFLPITERILQGEIPYKDFFTAYAPLSFYILSFGRTLTPNLEPYSSYYITTTLFQFLTAFLIGKILNEYSRSISSGAFGAGLTLLLFFTNEGMYVFLEPCTIFFSAVAVYFYLLSPSNKRTLIFAGISVGLSFFSKQYGILALPSLILVESINQNSIKKKCANIGLIAFGFFSVVCVLTAIFAVAGVPVSTLMGSLFYKGYPSKPTDMTKLLEFFLYQNVFIVGAAVALLQRNKIFFTSLSMTSFFIAPLFVRQFPHYFHLVIPFGVLVAVLGILRFWDGNRAGKIAAMLLICTTIFAARDAIRSDPIAIKGYRDAQYSLSTELNKRWPVGSQVLVFADPVVIFTAQLRPIDDFDPAYGFISNYPGEKIAEFIAKTNKILVHSNSKGYFTPEREKVERFVSMDFYAFLDSKHFIKIETIDDQYELWERMPSRG